MTKHFRFLAICLVAVAAFACSDDEISAEETASVGIQLVYPEGEETLSSVDVFLTNTSTDIEFTSVTDENGLAGFTIPHGQYEATVSEKRTDDENFTYVYNANKNINVTGDAIENLSLTKSSFKDGIIIKEIYNGGCPKDDGSGSFSQGQYVVLYNNSTSTQTLSNLCIAVANPANAQATNNDYVDGVLKYESEGWIPAGGAFWQFPSDVTIEPGAELVVALNSAIDNTQTYSQSINFANSEYYTCYDLESGYNNSLYYPAPASEIPTSNYLSAYRYGQGTAWVMSFTSPAFFLFTTEGTTPSAFAEDESNVDYHGDNQTAYNMRKKVPVEWVVDAIEVFANGYDNNQKRLTAGVDAGSITLTNKLGYTLYRNVDQEATEAIEDNEGKLVYNYSGGTEVDGSTSTDPSGIDAEASLANGAHIIYQDTNNSSVDFHQRNKASLRD